MMLPAVHKIIEFMVRIYDVQAYLKHTFIMAFLPYFETSYFIKAAQLVNMKDDEFFSFLHEYAYKGEAIQKKTMVKALARGHGVLFAKYAQWCYQSKDVLED
jgi:U3 small nucleolar RNA-associated protein 10